jgi:hypothetical protein
MFVRLPISVIARHDCAEAISVGDNEIATLRSQLRLVIGNQFRIKLIVAPVWIFQYTDKYS